MSAFGVGRGGNQRPKLGRVADVQRCENECPLTSNRHFKAAVPLSTRIALKAVTALTVIGPMTCRHSWDQSAT